MRGAGSPPAPARAPSQPAHPKQRTAELSGTALKKDRAGSMEGRAAKFAAEPQTYAALPAVLDSNRENLLRSEIRENNKHSDGRRCDAIRTIHSEVDAR